MTARSTILVVDDHPLFRRGVIQLLQLEPSFEVVGEAGDFHDAVRLAAEKEPDLTLLDLHLKGSGGLEILADRHHADIHVGDRLRAQRLLVRHIHLHGRGRVVAHLLDQVAPPVGGQHLHPARAIALDGIFRPACSIVWRNRSRSSARAIAS